jgi:hypothetical protein
MTGLSTTAAPLPGRPGDRTWLPAAHSQLHQLAIGVLFPCLVLGTALGQDRSAVYHDGVHDVMSIVGQVLLWIGLLAATEIILVVRGSGRVLLVIIAMLLGFRATGVVLGGSAEAVAGYTLANGVLYGLAAITVVIDDPERVHRQGYRFLAWSVPVMVLQLYGAPEWLQLWRTDVHNDAGLMPTLFHTDPNEGFSTLQVRPAGFMHANNFLSIIVLFLMAFHLARLRGKRLTKPDVALITVIVLAMSKLLYASFIIFTLLYLVVGTREQRRRIMKLWGLMAVCLAVYFALFPGVFLYNLSPNLALLNLGIRVADLRAALAGAAVADVSIQGLGGLELNRADIEAGTQSGYSSIARFLPMLVAVSVVALPLYAYKLRQLRRRRPDLAEIARNTALAFVVAPVISPFFGNPYFAYASGAMMLPWFVRARDDEATE